MKFSIRLFLCIIFLLSAFILPALGQKSKQVQRLEKQRKEALKAIEKTDRELQNTKKDKQDKQKHLNLLNKQVAQRKQMVQLLDNEVKELQSDIDSMTGVCHQLSVEEKARSDEYAQALQSMQKRKRSLDRILFISSAKSFDEGMRRMRFLEQYASAYKLASVRLRDTRSKLETERATVEDAKKEKGHLLVIREEEKKKLEGQQAEQRRQVQALGAKQKDLEAQLRKQKKQAEALNRKIEKQIAKEIEAAKRRAREERERLAREAKAKGKPVPAEPERKAETKGGYAMDASERALSGSFAQNKGRLPGPVCGRYRIVSDFGVHQHSELKKVQVNNGGIDIAVATGSDATSVFDGVVSSVFVIPGYNSAVMVRHGNYITVYANLSKVYVSSGTRVKTGQALGRAYTDPSNNQTIIHFEIWKERSKQNPRLWLR